MLFQAYQLGHQVVGRLRKEYASELEGCHKAIKERDVKIVDLEDRISDLNGDLERLRVSHSNIDMALHHSCVEYEKLLKEKEFLFF